MSTGRSSAPAPPSPGPSGASILTIGRISATTPWWPTSRRPATSCDSRTARATCTTPSSRPRSCGISARPKLVEVWILHHFREVLILEHDKKYMASFKRVEVLRGPKACPRHHYGGGHDKCDEAGRDH